MEGMISCGALSCIDMEGDMFSTESSSPDSIAWLLLPSCVSSSSDFANDLDEKDLGLLGKEGSWEEGLMGVDKPVDGVVNTALFRMVSGRSCSILLGLIVDRLRLPSLRLCGDGLVGEIRLASSMVSFRVRTGEGSCDGGTEVLEPRLLKSDSEARKKVVGMEDVAGGCG